jgi:hypothetical protein
MSWLFSLFGSSLKIDDDEPMHYEMNGKTLPDPETFPEGFENKNPLSRSYELAADVSFADWGYQPGSLVEEFDGQYYKNQSPYGLATLKEVEVPQ